MFKLYLISIIFIAFWWNASASVYLNLHSTYYVASNQNLNIAERKMYGQRLKSHSNLNSRNLRISNEVYKNDRLFLTDNRTMEYFPSNLAEVFPSLEWMSIKNSKLKEIHRNEICDLKNLIILTLAHNFLEYIEAELFTGNLNLQTIDLAHNRISIVDPTAFDGLLNLRFLHLHRNNCTSIRYETKILNLEAKVNRYNGTCWTDLGNIKPIIETLNHDQDLLNDKFYNISVVFKNVTKQNNINAGSTTNQHQVLESNEGFNLILISLGVVQILITVLIVILAILMTKEKKKNTRFNNSVKVNRNQVDTPIISNNASHSVDDPSETYKTALRSSPGIENDYEDPENLNIRLKDFNTKSNGNHSNKNVLVFNDDYAEVKDKEFDNDEMSYEEYSEVINQNETYATIQKKPKNLIL